MATDFDLITVTPWRSGGQHRLYVSDRRQSLGFFDESTGTLVLTDARHRPVVEQALRTAGYPHAPRGEEKEPARCAEPVVNPRRERFRAAAQPVRGGPPESSERGEDRTRTRRETTEPPQPDEPTDQRSRDHPGRTDHMPPAPLTDADDPEQVWVALAARRAPRATSGPHGRRDPATTLTALLQGEPPPDVSRHDKVTAQITALVDADPLWHVLTVDGTEIDHLLIGPGGAFALSTKVHPGATVQVTCQSVVVDGTAHPWVGVGLRASRRAGRTLSQACHQTVAVTTLLVIDADRLTTTLPPPVGVVALDHQDLCRWLHAQPEILTPGTVAMLADAAQQSASWYRR